MDGTHKLVRSRFIVHVAIDGYSRLVTYCRCANNNRAETVVDLFKIAGEEYGLPIRVRTDFGVENHRVWQYMLNKRQNTNTLMIGSSVYNQRVERLHRDVNIQVVNKFHNKFTSLEENGLLDPDSEADLFCLRLIYMPLINNRLNEFKSAHNLHSLSSENQLSPSQLFQILNFVKLACVRRLAVAE